jgi:hypothetical protein
MGDAPQSKSRWGLEPSEPEEEKKSVRIAPENSLNRC